jgi:oligo-1,6-glucosidase
MKNIPLFLLAIILTLSSCNSDSKNQISDKKTNTKMDNNWWKEAIVYQIYPRSFSDSNGDGIGDLKGITAKLDYIKSLNVDLIWLNPIYASPNKDNGYDISDYQQIMKEFGTMKDFDELLKGFKDRNIKVLMDLVVNHCSEEHPWFVSAKTSRESPYYNYFHWWPAEKGKPPYRWSIFDEKGYAWEFNKPTNSYYLHYFADAQPDLNWENPQLRQEVYKIMRFWLDKGINGFRLDAIGFCSKDTSWPIVPKEIDHPGKWVNYYGNGPHLHDYMQEMNREVLSKYPCTTVAEAAGDVDDVMKYVDSSRHELHMAYYFEATDYGYLPDEYKMPNPKGWDLVGWKKIFEKWTLAFDKKGWGTTFLANHDQPRMLTRWGNDSPEHRDAASKMLSTFILTMRGTPFTYFGDEIGMSNIKFDKIEEYNDIEIKSNYAQVKAKGGDLKRFLEGMKVSSRDNGRTPMQWDNTTSGGFTTGKPWLKVNENHAAINVTNQEKDPNSVLNYFRKLTALRKSDTIFVYGDWELQLKEDPNIFAYTRNYNGRKVLVLLNFRNVTTEAKMKFDAQKSKLLLGNMVDSDASMRLRPYEAKVIEME